MTVISGYESRTKRNEATRRRGTPRIGARSMEKKSLEDTLPYRFFIDPRIFRYRRLAQHELGDKCVVPTVSREPGEE